MPENLENAWALLRAPHPQPLQQVHMMLRCVAVLFALFATSWARAVWMPMPHEYPPSTVVRSRASRNLSCDTCLPTLQIQLGPVCEKKACPQLVFHFAWASRCCAAQSYYRRGISFSRDVAATGTSRKELEADASSGHSTESCVLSACAKRIPIGRWPTAIGTTSFTWCWRTFLRSLRRPLVHSTGSSTQHCTRRILTASLPMAPLSSTRTASRQYATHRARPF